MEERGDQAWSTVKRGCKTKKETEVKLEKMGVGEKVCLSQMFEYYFVGEHCKQVNTVVIGSMFFKLSQHF